MIALLSTLTVDGADLPALSKAVAACDRPAVARSVEGETKRHGAFLIDSFKEQGEIAAARADFAGRRRTLRAGSKSADTEQALTLASETLDDRQRALDDARNLDRLKQDAMGWFRQQFIIQCQGKAGGAPRLIDCSPSRAPRVTCPRRSATPSTARWFTP